MKPIKVAQNILPLGEFKTHASRVLRDLQATHQPVVITQNGKPAAVLVPPEEFDLMNDRARFVRGVEEGLTDAEAGRIVSDEELEKQLDTEFGPLKRKRK